MEPMTWAMLIMMVASMVLSIVLAPKQKQPQPGTYDDMNIPQIDEGTPQSVIFGEVWISDWFVLATGNFRTKKVKAKNAKK